MVFDYDIVIWVVKVCPASLKDPSWRCSKHYRLISLPLVGSSKRRLSICENCSHIAFRFLGALGGFIP